MHHFAHLVFELRRGFQHLFFFSYEVRRRMFLPPAMWHSSFTTITPPCWHLRQSLPAANLCFFKKKKKSGWESTCDHQSPFFSLFLSWETRCHKQTRLLLLPFFLSLTHTHTELSLWHKRGRGGAGAGRGGGRERREFLATASGLWNTIAFFFGGGGERGGERPFSLSLPPLLYRPVS